MIKKFLRIKFIFGVILLISSQDINSDEYEIKAENIEYSISYGMLSITYGEYDTNDSTTSRDYTNVSLSKEYSGFEFGLTYTDVDWDTANTYRDDFLVLSISKSL